MRSDTYGIMTAYGSPHLARKAEQVPHGLRERGSSKRICLLCYDIGEFCNKGMAVYKYNS